MPRRAHYGMQTNRTATGVSRRTSNLNREPLTSNTEPNLKSEHEPSRENREGVNDNLLQGSIEASSMSITGMSSLIG